MSSSLILCSNYEPFWIGLWRVTKSGFYTAASDDKLSGWTKKLQSTSQKPNMHQKGSWSLFGGLLPAWPTSAFWILAKPLHLRSMLSKSVRWTENCKPCSQHGSAENGSVLLHDSIWPHVAQVLQTLNESGCKVLPHLPYLPDLSPTDYHLFKHLDNILHGKCFPRVF